MQNYIKRFFSGFLMGVAEIVPGVSGSAIALMLGFYNNIIELLFNITEVAKVSVRFIIRKSSFNEIFIQIKKFDFKFAVPLGIGVIAAGVIMPDIVLYLFENYPAYTYALLLGLAISVTVVPLKEMKSKNITNFLIALVVFVATFIVLGLDPAKESSQNPSYLLLFFGGVLGISGMVLPALSGGFILIVIGLYYHIVGIVRDIVHFEASFEQIVDIAIFALGAGTGFITVSRLLKKLLDEKRDILMAIILGLIVASYRVVCPFVENSGGEGEFNVERVGLSNFSTQEILIICTITGLTALVLSFLTLKYSPEE